MPLVYKIYPKKKIFSIIRGKEEQFFYLTKRLSNVFFPYIEPGFLVEYVIGSKTKKIGEKIATEISSFKKIEDRQNGRTYFNIKNLRKEMFEVLLSFKNLLFLDFEMTLPKKNSGFEAEIIQAGGILANNNNKEITKFFYKIRPKDETALTKFTQNFLKMSKEELLKDAITFPEFYSIFKDLCKKYKPQIITWGENDFSVLKSDTINYKKNVFFKRNNFTNMLKIYRNYFQRGRDISLFSAYNEIVPDCKIGYQRHNALDDAYMTKEVFFSFLKIFANN